MGIGITNAGGGSSLNFDVKAYPTEEALLASTPRANTIGIITENKITSWEFAATEPSAPAEGMVWITVGTDSEVAFNILKKNSILIYPDSAQQYVGGAWVDVPALSYQGGKWNEWISYIVNESKAAEFIAQNENFTHVVDARGLVITPTGSNKVGSYYTKEKYDLTNVQAVCVSGASGNNKNGTYTPALVIATAPTVYNGSSVTNMAAFAKIKQNVYAMQPDEIFVDVSNLSGLYHIAITVDSVDKSEFIIPRIYMR